MHQNIDTTIRSTKSPINFSEISEGDLIGDIDERKIIVVEEDGGNRVSKKIPLILVYNKTSNPYIDRLDFNQYPYTSLGKKYNFNLGRHKY